MSRSYNTEGVGLTTVGVGLDFNDPLMRGLAEQGDGNFYFVEDSQAVIEVFAEEIQYFTTAIAENLVVSVKTVETHRTNLMHKLDLHDRTELVKYAIRKGLISLEPDQEVGTGAA